MESREGKVSSWEITSGYRGFRVHEFILGYSKYLRRSWKVDRYTFAFHKMSKMGSVAYSTATWKLEGYGLSTSYNFFLGDTFFFESSAVVEKHWAWQPSTKEYPNTISYGNATRLVVSGQFGNQWHWKDFHFGITWIGRMFPLIRDEDYQTEDSYSGSFNDFIISNSNLFLRASVGWAI